jgi:FkbH-like protein
VGLYEDKAFVGDFGIMKMVDREWLESQRESFKSLVFNGRVDQAVQSIKSIWMTMPSLSLASLINNSFKDVAVGYFTKRNVFILRSSTIEPLIPFLKASGYLFGFDLTISVGEFNTYSQEILDSTSQLYAANPDDVILALDAKSISSELWFNGDRLSDEEREKKAEACIQNITELVVRFRQQSNANMIVHGMEIPRWSELGLLQERRSFSVSDAFRKINDELRKRIQQIADAHFLDLDRLAGFVGTSLWGDESKWFLARTIVSSPCMHVLVNEWMRFICATSHRACKVIVTDLDNTLWGGVLGEDGIEGIKVDAEYPGFAFQGVQRCLREFSNSGGLLAIASKNNQVDALKVFENHPGMLLKHQDFVSIRINWDEKWRNLVGISEELNLGLESFVFIDDNPVERDAIRKFLPQVDVLELPDDPTQFVSTIRNYPRFTRVAVSNEDAKRNQLYVEQRRRVDAQKSSTNLDEFYLNLNQTVRVVSVDPISLPRIAQLTQKTNQFNLTTRRYTESEIHSGIEKSGWKVFAIHVKDSFGDNGIVGVCIVKPHNKPATLEIDTFLLSCRVIGRKIETVMLALIVDLAKAAGAEFLVGKFIPTAKNQPCCSFYPDNSFTTTYRGESEVHYECKLTDTVIEFPKWITLERRELLR